MPEMMTVPEVAAILRLSRYHTYQLIAQKKIPSVRVSQRAIRVRRDVLERLIADGGIPAAQDEPSLPSAG